MPIGSGIVYNTGDLILNQVSSSGTAFLETKIAAATSSLIYFDSTARINSASLNSITVGTASYVSGSNSIVTNFTASNISASGTGSFGIVGIGTTNPSYLLHLKGGGIGVDRSNISSTAVTPILSVKMSGSGAVFNDIISVQNSTSADQSNLIIGHGSGLGQSTFIGAGESATYASNLTGWGGEYLYLGADEGVVAVTNLQSGPAAAYYPFTISPNGSIRMQYQLSGSSWSGASDSYTLNVSGSNTQGLLYVQSPTAPNALFVSGSGNVGIGTTSPATFLDVVGGNGSYPTSSGTVQATGSIVRLRNGNSNLVLDIGGNGGNGNWLQSTSRIDLSLGYPLLLNPNGGNVGVGTTSPQFLLDVVNTNTTSKLRIGNAGNNFGAQLILAGSNTTKNWVIANQQNLNGTLEFTQTTTTGSSTVDTTPAMVINSSGYVGIGTTSPSTYSSQVAIETSLTRGMMVFNTTLADAGTFYGLGFGYAMSNYNSAYIGFYKAGNANTSNRLFFSLWNQDNILNLTGLGYVGIGTTSPTTKLHITGSHVSGNGMSRFESSDYAIISLKTPSNGDGSDGYWGFRAQDTANNDLMFYGYRYKPTFSGFWVDPSFAGIISKGFFVRNSDGNVGIGTSSPANKLDVLGNISASIISSSRYYSAVPASFVSSFSTTGSTSAPGFTFELGSISQSHQPRGFIQVNDYYNSFNNGQNLQLKSFSNGVNYGGWMLMSNWSGTMRIGATGSSAYNANELPPTYMEVGTATVSLVGLTLSGTASWATNATTAQTANALNTANNYTITNLTANNITASSISSSFAYLSNIGFSDQTVTPDTSIFPTGSTSGGFILDGGVYTNGLYRTRFVKIDRSANLSLYIQETKGSSGSFSNLVRFGTHANSPNTFEVFGSTNIQGSITSSNFVGSHIGNTTGTASWATNALTASFLPVGTYNITSSWAQNVVSASFATTAQTANALNASNTYTVAGLTSAYVDVTGAGTIPTTGIYRPSTKTLGLSADGTLIFKISNVSSPATSSIETGNFIVSGSVGIGTTSPIQKLHIVGSTLITNNNYHYGYTVAGAQSNLIGISSADNIMVGQNNVNHANTIIYGGLGVIDLNTSGSTRMRVTYDGNVGIGTTSPGAKLELYNGNFKISDGNRIIFGASDPQIYGNSGVLTFRTNSTDKMYLDTNGNLGIGTSTPSSKLHISGSGQTILRIDSDTTTNIAQVQVKANGDGVLIAGMYGTASAGNNFGVTAASQAYVGTTTLNSGYPSSLVIGNVSSIPIAFSTNNTERMRIDGSGNVGIGTTSPVNKLQVAGNISGSSFTSSISNAVGFLGTSSWAQNVVSASYATTAQTANALNTGNSYTIAGLTNNGTLSQQGTLSMGSGYQILATTGTAPIPGIAFVGDTNTGIYSPSADTIGFSISGSEKIRIDSNGNVGIGTTSSGGILDVYGATSIFRYDTAGAASLYLRNWTSGGTTQMIFGVASGDDQSTTLSFASNIFSIGNYGDPGSEIRFGTRNSSTADIRVTINQDGNVGIGTTNPGAKLEVQSGSILLRGDGNATFGTYYASAGENTFFTLHSGSGNTFHIGNDVAGTYYSTMTFTAAASSIGGNVGIGTTTINQKLSIYPGTTGGIALQDSGGTTRSYFFIDNTNPTYSTGIRTENYYLDFDSSGGAQNAIRFYTGTGGIGTGTERVRINSSGNVGIGTSSPGARLEISGSSNSALLNIKSPISGAIVYVSGSGAVGINTSNIGAYTLQVNGSFAATTKSFVIDHPTKAGKRLIYGSLESPYHGIRLTGRDTIKDGKCKVELPDYMYKLILHDSINIQLTGIKCNKTLYVDEINIPENYFTIAYDKGVFESYKDYDFFWDFTAIRADVPELNTEL